MAVEIFELYRLIAIARTRRPTGPDELSETEFLTLDLLENEEPLTIGEVQKRIGVVPAQMSRIVRSLEGAGGKAFVACKINANDRRRVDISLTPAGKTALENYRNVRMGTMYHVLKALKPLDRLEFMRMLREIRGAFQSLLNLDE